MPHFLGSLGPLIGRWCFEGQMKKYRHFLFLSLSVFVPMCIVTAFLLVNGHRLRSGMPSLMWGKAVLLSAVAVGEFSIVFAFSSIGSRLLALVIYPLLAYVALVAYVMFFGAVFFPDLPW